MIRHSIFSSKLGQSHRGSSHLRTGCARAKFRPSTGNPEAFKQEAIRRANGRCQMCGRTVGNHGAYLVANAIGLEGSGRSGELSDFWAICEQCDAGRSDGSPFMNADAELVRRLTAHKSVHRRIGELLKAVGVGNRVPSSLIKAVAGQSSWRQRLRELRYPVIGWKIEARLFVRPSGRRCSDYVLLSYKDWPDDPTETIKQFEKARRKLKEAAQQKSKGR